MTENSVSARANPNEASWPLQFIFFDFGFGHKILVRVQVGTLISGLPNAIISNLLLVRFCKMTSLLATYYFRCTMQYIPSGTDSLRKICCCLCLLKEGSCWRMQLRLMPALYDFGPSRPYLYTDETTSFPVYAYSSESSINDTGHRSFVP